MPGVLLMCNVMLTIGVFGGALGGCGLDRPDLETERAAPAMDAERP